MTTVGRFERRGIARAARALVPCLLAMGCATPRPEGAAADTTLAPGSGAGASGIGARMDSLPPNTTPAPPTDAPSPVALELDRARYAPGATVRLRIVNRSDVGYGYNACTRVIERRAGNGWSPLADESRICTMELRLLGARETATQDTELPQSLAAGEYRMVLALSREEGPPPGPGIPSPGPVRATSASFRVD